ncbi:MAG: prsA3, partial [Acidobacteria bacterium]|nr:prsA3 [Acidobacteriota bacterium]
GDEQLKKYYTDNPERFQQPEAVQVAHVLIRVPEKADAAARRKARAEAEQVRAAAFRGEDFAALARQHSMDQGSAARGGDLGFLARGQSVPAFEEAAFSLKPGQVSQVVETTFGFHVIKAGEHREARKVPLEEVKGEVTDYLKQQQVQEKTAALVEQLKAKGKVEILI